MPSDQIIVSSVTLGELRYGVEKSSARDRNERALNYFLAHLVVVPWGGAAAVCYGEIRALLERLGTPIGNLDLMIAAHARSIGATLVTHNGREFQRVPGLQWEDWV